MTPIEKQQIFYKELKELLLKHNAEICLEFFEQRYLSEPKIVVDFKYDESLFQDNGTGIIPQLVLGSSEDGK